MAQGVRVGARAADGGNGCGWCEVWAKPLANGDVAVVLLNRAPPAGAPAAGAANISLTFAQVLPPAPAAAAAAAAASCADVGHEREAQHRHAVRRHLARDEAALEHAEVGARPQVAHAHAARCPPCPPTLPRRRRRRRRARAAAPARRSG